MKKKSLKIERRDFLKLLSALPVVYTFGCRGPEEEKAVIEEKIEEKKLIDPDASLRKLIRLVGPWKNQAQADDFLDRFMGAGHAVAPYLPDKGISIQALASRFPDNTTALQRIDFQNIPDKERELLFELTRQLYSFVEVRFLVADEQPWGECLPDNLQYTRPPKSTGVGDNNVRIKQIPSCGLLVSFRERAGSNLLQI